MFNTPLGSDNKDAPWNEVEQEREPEELFCNGCGEKVEMLLDGLCEDCHEYNENNK